MRKSLKIIFLTALLALVFANGLPLAKAEYPENIKRLLEQIVDLKTQIAKLQVKLMQVQGKVPSYQGVPTDFVFEKELKYDDSNNDVKYLQAILKAEGLFCQKCQITGYYGYWTQKAVKAFQEKYASEILSFLGLSEGSGLVEKATQAKLNSLLVSTAKTAATPSPTPLPTPSPSPSPSPSPTPSPSPSPTPSPSPSPSPVAFDFSVSLSPSSGSVVQGSSISLALNASLISGSSQTVAFTATTQTLGISTNLNPSSCTLPCSSGVIITVGANVPSGTHSISINGTAASLVRGASYALNVTSAGTLFVLLSANPNSSYAPLNGVTLATTVSGTATGNINYTFYCDRADSGTNITSDYIHKKDSIAANPYSSTLPCNYALPGNYKAKVIVERGTLVAESRANVTVTEPPMVLNPKIYLLIYNPLIESAGNKKLTTLNGWNDPDQLTSQYIQDVKGSSYNLVNYQISERLEVDGIPQLKDGYQYTDNTYLQCWNNHSTCHSPEGVDYNLILQQYGLCEKLNAGQIDEVWLFGGPWFGYWESTLAGPNAFWYNSPPVTGTTCNKLLPIMGFSYERGVSEMLEDLGHRTESTMWHVYGSWNNTLSDHAWNLYTHYDKTTPGQARCGNVHYAPNSQSDYDWSNTSYVDSYCVDWLNFPNLTGIKQNINCSTWNCDSRSYHKWWLDHLPHASGTSSGKLNNWWRYIADYNNISQ